LQSLLAASDAPQTTTANSRAPTPTATPSGSASKTPPASIVLMSDGQSNTGPDPLDIAQKAIEMGVKVYTIGIGTPQGTVLQIQGRSILTRLDEDTLREVADQTGGRYFNAQDNEDLKQIYDELARSRDFKDEDTEVTFAFAGAALLFSMVAGALGLLWFNRLP
jgi:Ca-activated chloride channel family protein